MSQRIGGPGQLLPPPQNLYPSQLTNAPADWSTNEIAIASGDTLVIPAGDWVIESGGYSSLQWFDPVTGIWRTVKPPRGGYKVVFSDGANYRVANLTGTPVSATIANGGTGYTQSTLTITANVGGSTWQGIVGGSLSIVTVANAGSGYTMPPLVPIPHAPLGLGVNATANATLANGTVASVSLANFGAGYISAPTPLVLLPNPNDPNALNGTITNATITIGLTNAGKVTAALCTNNGASLATISALTLTAAGGAGSGATITPNVAQVMTGVTVGGTGGGIAAANILTSEGGQPVSTAAIANPTVDLSGFMPIPASAVLAVSTGAVTSVATIYDRGYFLSTPTAVVINNGITTTATTITFTTGGVNDTVTLQPAAG
jgi:hypothetical protein